MRVVLSARFMTTGPLSLGTDTWVGHEVMMVSGGSAVLIGAYCDIASRVTFVTGAHFINPSGPHFASEGFSLPISVGDGCWICTGAPIFGRTTTGARSIFAAGTVERGEFPLGSFIGGVPARTL